MQWVFEEQFAGLAEHAAPVIRELHRRKHRVTLACHQAEKHAFQQLINADFYHGHPELVTIENWRWNSTPPDVLFSVLPGAPGKLLRDSQGPADILRVALPHGLTDKHTKFPHEVIGHPLGYFNILLASGPNMFEGSWQKYIKRHPQTESALNIIPTGSPKTDALFEPDFDRDAQCRQRGLDPAKPTILYAPTFQKEASLEQAGIAIITALAACDANILVRLHHLSINPSVGFATEHHGGKDWRATLRKLANQHPNLKPVDGDSTPYFKLADILVGDVSGACYEFIVQNKPVIFWDCPQYFARYGDDNIAYHGRQAGTIVDSIPMLQQAIAHELAHPDHKSSNRRTLINALCFRRGDAAAFAVDQLEQLHRSRQFPTHGVTANLHYDALLNAYISERIHRAWLEHGPLTLMGAGKHTVALLAQLAQQPQLPPIHQLFSNILDDNPQKTFIHDLPIATPDSITTPPACVILSTDYYQEEMQTRLKQLWGDATITIDLYEPFPWHRPQSKLT